MRKSKRSSRRRKPETAETAAVAPLFEEEVEGGEHEAVEPDANAHRRVREGELYYVEDEAAPEGWSVVEIAGTEDGPLAAFAVGQLEAMPLAEIEGRILGPVARPDVRTARRAA